MNKISFQPARCCAKVRASLICRAGAENTVIDNEVYTATLSAVSLRPKFMVLDVKVLPIRKDGSMALSMFSPPSRPFCASEKRPEWFFKSHNGAETMTTVNTPTTPKTGTTPAANIPRYSTPATVHLDRLALIQRADNALSMARWHLRKQSTPEVIRLATGKAVCCPCPQTGLR